VTLVPFAEAPSPKLQLVSPEIDHTSSGEAQNVSYRHCHITQVRPAHTRTPPHQFYTLPCSIVPWLDLVYTLRLVAPPPPHCFQVPKSTARRPELNGDRCATSQDLAVLGALTGHDELLVMSTGLGDLTQLAVRLAERASRRGQRIALE
jgi:hypothetical protein